MNDDRPVTIVWSTPDPASNNIARSLITVYGFKEKAKDQFVHPDQNVRLVRVGKPGIHVEPGDLSQESSSILFASKHVSATNTPAMTVHATGNLTNKAEFGGRPEEVSFVEPAKIQTALRTIRDSVSDSGLEIDVTMEATHHGPTSFPIPVCFVEIGSGAREWADPALGQIAAHAIMEAARVTKGTGKTAVGFGGTHYSAKFTRLSLEGTYQIGHVVPRHALEYGVSDLVLKDTIVKTIGSSVTALVDWKGMTGSDRRRIVASLETLGCSIERC